MTNDDEQTPGERLNQRERTVLYTLINDPSLWTVAELARDTGKDGLWTSDAIAALDAAGLVHRFIVRRAVVEDQQQFEEIVIATRAARRLDELQGGPL